MSEQIQKSRGVTSNYRQDRGGVPAQFGPFSGVVKNNVDPTRSGRLQVYIEVFSGGDPEDSSKWTTVRYLPSFFGNTHQIVRQVLATELILEIKTVMACGLLHLTWE